MLLSIAILLGRFSIIPGMEMGGKALTYAFHLMPRA